jgi:hypothetical protein
MIKGNIQSVHHSLAYGGKRYEHKYREVVNDIECLNGELITVKWFNIPINSAYNMTFSAGVVVDKVDKTVASEESIRSYYRDVIQKDRTMIESLKDVLQKE